MSRATYLYCVVRSVSRPGAANVPPGVPGGGTPTVVTIDKGLWLVTASVPLDRYGSEPLEIVLRDLDAVGAIALAHEAVVEHFVRPPVASVIPMKLFTMFSTPARAQAEMRRQRSGLDAVFERIHGCEEWGVRVTRKPVREAGTRKLQASSGTAFLAARKAARDRSRSAARAAAEAADAAFDSLSAIAREGRRRGDEPAGVTTPVLDAAFLVPARRRAKFRAAAARLAEQLEKSGGRMTLSGPWPPYHFVSGPAEGTA